MTMKAFLCYLLIVLIVTCFCWILLGGINKDKLRIFLRAGIVSIAICPTLHFQDESMVFAPAWVVISWALSGDTYFLATGIISIIIFWILFFVTAVFFHRLKKDLEKDLGSGLHI